MAISLPGIDEPVGGSWSSPYTSELPFGVEVEGHDRTQFEIKLSFDPTPGNYSNDRPFERFGSEVYFFLPKNLGIDANTFTKEQFYSSFIRYVRFKTPELTLADLLDPACRQSPLSALHYALKSLLDVVDPKMNDEAIRQGKLLGCYTSRFFRNGTRQLRRKLKEGTLSAEVLEMFLDSGTEILQRYRQIWPRFETHLVAKRVSAELRWVDEYLSYRWEGSLATLARAYLKEGLPVPERFAQLAETEITFRRAHGYVCLDDTELSTREYYSYRLSALKRHISSVLYLDASIVTQSWRMYSQVIAATGAGLAAAFYGITMAQSQRVVQVTDFLWVMTIAVLLYVLKDRVKDISKEKLTHAFQRRFPDYVRQVQDAETHETIATISERLSYTSKDDLVSEVRQVRSNVHTIELDEERAETVIRYQTDVQVEKPSPGGQPRRIKLIFRFNIQPYIARLDNPLVPIRYYDPALGDFRSDLAPKVYHINVICRLARWDAWGKIPRTSLLRVRIVVDKDGIVRIEEVLPNCPTPLLEAALHKLESHPNDLADMDQTVLDP
ncbi:MAG: hypothetical protein H7338_01555 [Candidatus Sericytochromatia bacterium]|nr:hypothetical protein [Candidatus Sericytochromatia bacterium]